ncbi:hypothetical protein [Buttiauxella gaviniae]|uniref:hypothetical protein n=1 Tax=Buttiauxella gaviniae TaxID=82990 RepID=UPI0039770635
MFNFELKFSELFTPVLYIAPGIFILWRAKGIQNVLRFLARYFNISYTDKRMKELDESWFNIQLFRFTTGINISTIESARLIQEKLNTGELKASLFTFTSNWGDITRVVKRWEPVMTYVTAFFFFVLGSLAWYEQSTLVYNYTRVDYGNLSYYISNDNVIMNPISSPPNTSEARSKKDCEEALKTGVIPEGSLFDNSCKYLLNNSDVSKKRLNGEIEKVNTTKRNLTILSYLYCILSVLWAFTFYRFTQANIAVRAIIPTAGRKP